jgi:serine protease AprX
MKCFTFNSTIFAGALSLIAGSSAVVISNTEVVDIPSLVGVDRQNETVKDKPVTEGKSYILHGLGSDALKAVVENVGGVVSREFPIISAVSAVLNSDQVSQLGSYENLRVSEDRTVVTESNKRQFVVDTLITTQTRANLAHRWGIKGDGVRVAVLDSGILLTGPQGSHLRYDTRDQGRVYAKYDAIKGAENRTLNDDDNGHGSHITAIIASSLKDESGHYNGVAPDADLLSIKAFDADGKGSYSQVLDGLNWVYQNQNKYDIKVLNLSLGAEVQSTYWHDPISLAVMKLWDAGIVVVTSAGNSGSDFGTVSVPGNNPYIITVGAATDSYTPYELNDDRVTTFSAQGPTFEGFVKPDIVSYGGHVAAKFDKTVVKGRFKEFDEGEDYHQVSGTSQASAVVAGTVALMLQHNPNLSPDDIKCRLIASAKRGVKDSQGNYASPFAVGAGMVDAFSAISSRAMGCANRGLDIKSDLANTTHFKGPVSLDEANDMTIDVQNGEVSVNGSPWVKAGQLSSVWDGATSLDSSEWNALGLEGTPWGANVGIEGSPWGNTVNIEGSPWKKAHSFLDGADWDGQSDLEGTVWSDSSVATETAEDPSL